MPISGLSKICKNAFGILEVEYLPTIYLDKSLAEDMAFNGVFKGNLGSAFPLLFYKAHLAPRGKAFSQNPTETEQGDVNDYSISGLILEDTPELANELKHMKRYRYVVKFKDGDGNVRILGNVEYPCRFNYSFQKSENGNFYQISWTAKMPTQLYFA